MLRAILQVPPEQSIMYSPEVDNVYKTTHDVRAARDVFDLADTYGPEELTALRKLNYRINRTSWG